MINTLIPKSLCTRCGACFAADSRNVLRKDSEGFPVYSCNDKDYIESLLEVCSGENWNYRTLLNDVHGSDYPFDPVSPDKGKILRLGIAHSTDKTYVEQGQSGGVSTSIFSAALSSGLIRQAVLVRRPRPGSTLSPFASEPFVAKNPEEVLEGSGSKYTICSTLEKIPEVEAAGLHYGLSLLPCQTVGFHRLRMAGKLNSDGLCKLIIGPFCGFNMETRMGDEFSKALGLDPLNVSRFANRAGPFPGETLFETKKGEKVLFDRTAHRALYRMFSPNRCFTCTDFSNELADLSIADCWRPSGHGGFEFPRGAAWVLIRTEAGERAINDAIDQGKLEFHEMPLDANDKHWEQSLLHRKVRSYHRIESFAKQGIPTPKFDYPTPDLSKDLRESDRADLFFIRIFKHKWIRKPFLKYWVHIHKENASATSKQISKYLGTKAFTHRMDTDPPQKAFLICLKMNIKGLLRSLGFAKHKPMSRRLRSVASRCKRFISPPSKAVDHHLKSSDSQIENFRSWGYFNEKYLGSPKILMAAGHGYGNVGDEAQCGACISRWKQVAPDCKITLFSPNPGYTEALHGEECEWAPRVAWFKSNTSNCYNDSQAAFYRTFRSLKWRLTLSAHLLKRGLPLLFCSPREASVLQAIMSHDLLHISGGGFLTGKTRSRLWENCLLIQICHLLGTKVILTGHNIGVFQDKKDRKLARKSFSLTSYIGLRDKGTSEKELNDIGVSGPTIESTCDDALFCPRATREEIRSVVQAAGADPDRPWVAVNVHHWGQEVSERPKVEQRFSELCDELTACGLQSVFIAMTPSDEGAEQGVVQKMATSGFLIPYSPDYRIARGVIADAQFCFTMKHHPIVFAQGEGVPVVSIALDAYYEHKNRGALANTGHEDCLYEKEAFYGQSFEGVFRETLSRREEIHLQMKNWVHHMAERELEVYTTSLEGI